MKATYSYDAYGNLTSSTGSVANPFLFAGQYKDTQSGLYYMQARYYDSTTAQFLSRDPAVIVTRSVFEYVNSNPLNVIDPGGLDGCGWNPICYAGNAAEWVAQNPVQAAGYVLGVAAAATGIGAIVEGSVALGVIAISSGVAAGALDGPACLSSGGVSCVGAGLGVTGALFAAPEVALGIAGVSETSTAFAVARGCSAFGWSLGVAGTILDAFHSFATQ